MGYNWWGWSILFYFAAALFLAVSGTDAVELGLSPVTHKWIVIILGAIAGLAGKVGPSWLSKSPEPVNFPLDEGGLK
jgi:hypothetical protein